MQIEVSGDEEGGFVDAMVPEVAAKLAWGALGSRAKVESEIDLMLDTLRSFWRREPDERLQLLSAMTSRSTQLAIHLHRLEGIREWRMIRTQQIERLLAECDRQWKTASREIEVRRLDQELMK